MLLGMSCSASRKPYFAASVPLPSSLSPSAHSTHSPISENHCLPSELTERGFPSEPN